MPDTLEFFLRFAGDALRGGIGGDEVGMLLFEFLQLGVKLIVVVIGNRRLRLDVVEAVVPADLLTQFGDSLLWFHTRRTRRPRRSRRSCPPPSPASRMSDAGQTVGGTRR